MKNPKLKPLFDEIKAIFTPFEKRFLVATNELDRYELTGNTEYTVMSERTQKYTKHKNAYFAGLLIQKDYVGFYFMPVAYNDNMEIFSDREFSLLNSLRKGKSCHYIKKLTPELSVEIHKALVLGEKDYRSKGYLV